MKLKDCKVKPPFLTLPCMSSKMQFSSPKRLLPSSSSLKSTETLSRSTPESSGTFTAARISTSAADPNRNRNKENHSLDPSTSYRDAVLKSRCPESGAGLSEQVSARTFYGSGSTSSRTWNSQVSVKMKEKSKKIITSTTKKELVAKINRINKKGKKNLALPGYFDDNLKFCDDLAQDHQDSHTGLTPPPPLKPFPGAVSEPAPATGNSLSTSFTRDLVDKSHLVEDSEVLSRPSFVEGITSLPSPPRLMVQPHSIGLKVFFF